MKLNIRDFFWLVLVVGTGVGWIVDHRHLAEAYSSAIQGRDGAVTYAQIMQRGFEAAKTKLDECQKKAQSER